MRVPSFPTVVERDANDALGGLYDVLLKQEVNAVRVRSVLPPDVVRTVVERLESGGFAVATTRVPEGEPVQLSGMPLQWAEPDLADYLRTAAAYRVASQTLWGAIDHERVVQTLLSSLTATTVEPMRHAHGALYTPTTIRRLSSGGAIPPHLENHQLAFAPCTELRQSIDTSAVMSFLFLLAAPESGGELVLHEMTDHDFERSERARSGQVALRAELARHRSGAIHLEVGDALVFDSGRYVHEVTPVVGARRRWTIGGLLARRRGGGGVVYWG